MSSVIPSFENSFNTMFRKVDSGLAQHMDLLVQYHSRHCDRANTLRVTQEKIQELSVHLTADRVSSMIREGRYEQAFRLALGRRYLSMTPHICSQVCRVFA